jgi:predicted O-methyltransferase YrrM
MKALWAFVARRCSGVEQGRVFLNASRDDLASLFAELGYARGAEVGVWMGDFSRRLCERVQGLRLTCVDPWESYAEYTDKKNDAARLEHAYRKACATLAPYGCEILRTTSLKAAEHVPDGSLDFVYIDGNHGEAFVAADLEAWTPKVRRGGIVAGHDYVVEPSKPWLQVKPAVDAFTRERAINPVYVLTRDKSPSFFWFVGMKHDTNP